MVGRWALITSIFQVFYSILSCHLLSVYFVKPFIFLSMGTSKGKLPKSIWPLTMVGASLAISILLASTHSINLPLNIMSEFKLEWRRNFSTKGKNQNVTLASSPVFSSFVVRWNSINFSKVSADTEFISNSLH